MKLLLLASLSLVYFNLQAQVFDPIKNWFELSPFFIQEAVKSNQIASIYISIQEKNDGEPIKNRSEFLKYEFDRNGFILKSQKSISLSTKSDTAEFLYEYYPSGLLKRREEIQGPFHYSYSFLYKNELPLKEIKIDEHRLPKDTIYQRTFKVKKADSLLEILTLNLSGKAYKKRVIKFHHNHNPLSDKTSFTRNQNYTAVNYLYKDNWIREIHKTTYYQKLEKQKLLLYYQGEKLDHLVFFENDERIKKYAILYSNDGLEQTVIERNFKHSSIKIYNIYYSYY